MVKGIVSHKEFLERMKEHYTSMVSFNKTSFRLNWFVVVMTAIVSILILWISANYFIEGEWLLGLLELSMAILNGGLCFFSAKRIKPLKRDLECSKNELELFRDELERLEEIENELENGEIQ